MKPLRLFFLAAILPLAPALHAIDGFGPWKFGMSKTDVYGVTAFGPYAAVRSTGGLETFHGDWNGARTNISFVFSERGLVKIQIWVYEGKDIERALSALETAANYIESNFGPIDVQGRAAPSGKGGLSAREVAHKFLLETPSGSMAKLQLGPQKMPEGAIVFSSLFKHPQHGFYVFLYFTAPPI